MLIKYTGNRLSVSHSCRGQKYYFGKENNKTLEVPEKLAIQLMKVGEYMPVLPEPVVEEKKPELVVEEKKKVKIKPKIKFEK